MCGIIGTITDSNQIIDWNSGLASLAHRGPDGQGEKVLLLNNIQVWLAHTRLSILDLSPAGHQPMQSKNGRWWLTFNGEIYNHLELRQSLQCSFKGHSDTETLIELIAQQGITSILPKLNGMFAFAALDTHNNKLYLVRDPYGIKPLYYFQKNNTFAFSSEVKALHKMGLLEAAPDVNALQGFLSLRYVPSPDTLWKGIQRLKPGHILDLNLDSMEVNISSFIKPVSTQFSGTLEEASSAYQGQLKEAIGRQLLSDVPVGVLLSGGIDSALVAAMAKDLGHQLPCFTVGFGQQHSECEISDAQETAQVLGLPISSIVVTPEAMLEALPNIVKSVEEPLGTTSIMPMWHLVQRVREDVTVVLTGQGTDEPWGGYRRYQVEMVRRLMPSTSFWHLLKNIGNIAGSRLPDVLERGLRTLPEAQLANRALEACALFSASERQLLTGSSDHGGTLDIMNDWMTWLKPSGCSAAESMMRVDARMNLADDLLLYGDKISMATSLEARVPMLDIELMKFVESLPLHYRVTLGRSKIAHKQMAERYLPASIVHRKKKGFQVPFGEWSRGAWRDFVEEALLADNAPHLAYFNKKGLETLWHEHLTQKRDRSRQIFALLMLSLWWREMVSIT